MNSIFVIHPYKHEGVWMFDDEKVGLVQEPFVCGVDDIIGKLVVNIPGAEEGFNLFFSSSPFPGYQAEFEWRRDDFEGNWYYLSSLDMEGWLCPALLKYFETAPKIIYAQFKQKNV